jgi:outer membrane protein OmpA-like peptidoglycan-associated protein
MMHFYRLATALCLLFSISSAFSQTIDPKLYNVGANVNSALRELAPIISPDGKTLYVMVYGHQDNQGTADIWISNVMDKDGNWGEKTQMDFPFNQVSYNQVMSVSPDGNTLMVRGTIINGNANQKDYSYIKRSAQGWSDPESLIIDDYETMNHGTMYAASLSNSGKQLILSFQEKNKSNDLYVSFLKEDKSWSSPVSLGDSINSGKSEFSPFLASDNSTLYFASNKAGGEGGYDIYVSKRLDDSWQHWSKPKNLGTPFNSSGNEMYYTLDAEGSYAYIASTKNSMGDYDIFKIQIKQEDRPDPVILVYGKVLNGKTGENIDAAVAFENLVDGAEIGIARTNPQTGEYKIILPYGKNYGFNASAEKFIPVSDNLDLSQAESYKEIRRDLTLMPIEVGTTVRLNNIFFENAQATLMENSFAELNKVIKLMQQNSEMEIMISGHTDAVGSAESNQKLSENRAAAVMNYLTNNGIAVDRIKSEGLGETKPMAENDTEEGKQQNRRVEFTIVKK